MNLIGEIGNFIIKYQGSIQAAAIIVLLIAGIVIIIKAFANSKKKTELLSQINENVSQIHTNVKHFNDKKTEVIYIDNRVPPGESTAEKRDEINLTENTKNDADIDKVQEEKTERNLSIESIEPEERIMPSLKYFSRDCAISKTGKQYTVEELNAQIKD